MLLGQDYLMSACYSFALKLLNDLSEYENANNARKIEKSIN